MTHEEALKPHLPPPLLAKAVRYIANTELRLNIIHHADVPAYEKIGQQMFWNATEEGVDFWRNIYIRLLNDKPLQQ